ncbi:unnamed protein product [Polarella glacialis]|uniref:Calcineurin-like phosphoesterase domain-containing protein n=1 Tax=Polarella glacialis TaxID=89957 RepID=A0A813EGJ8_POLGL|nr:unnamed protein product [Polarella glacialis]CAE8707363.1 unnamed protein product [Polarella glacialis]
MVALSRSGLVAALCCLSAELRPFALGVSSGTGVFEPWLEELWATEGRPGSGWGSGPGGAKPLELRIAKALGSKGYNKVRISVIGQEPQEFTDFNFTYNEQFKYRWIENFLHSALVDLQPGANTFSIGGQQVVVDLPAEDEGIRGVLWSDPCFSSKYINCKYADRFQTFNHSIAMLNAAFADPSMNMFSILGDNFYDQTGELSKTFFDRLSPDVKRRFMLIVNGNHDNWVCGGPNCGTKSDNFAIGQMQYYPSDTVASTLAPQSDSIFLDFSKDPDADGGQYNSFQNVGTNFLVYHKLGNIGFLGFSGAAEFNDTLPHFKEACQYFNESKPATVFLLGHWNKDNDGARPGMSVPEVRTELLKLPECAFLGDRLKYMDGHQHCNFVHDKDATGPFGFMIGAHGMDDDSCEAQAGFLFMDSTKGRVRLHYFETASESRGDRFEEILACVTSHGLAGCTQLADTWLDIPAAVQESTIEWV